jgi:hypothetical protein
MPTIAEHIGSLEQQRRDAERRLSDATAAMKRLVARVEALGRKPEVLTEAEAAEVDRLVDAKRQAKEDISRLDGRLEEARRVEAEEDEFQRQARETHPTGAARRHANTDDGDA